MRRRYLAVAVAAAVGFPSAAGADDSYRAELVVSDLATVGLVAGSVAIGDEGAKYTLGVAALTYLVAPPVIHGVRDGGSRAILSLGVRVGAPLVTTLIGVSTCKGMGCIAAGILGIAAGALGAMIIDDLLLSTSVAGEPASPRLIRFGATF